jgi:hypothetical protein
MRFRDRFIFRNFWGKYATWKKIDFQYWIDIKFNGKYLIVEICGIIIFAIGIRGYEITTTLFNFVFSFLFQRINNGGK